MKIAESMKDTTRDIMASYNQRVKAVGGIVDDARSTLNRFGRDRRKMSADQSKALAEFTGELSSTIAALLKKISQDHAAMSKEQKDELVKFVKGVQNSVGKMIQDFTAERGEMSDALKKELAKSVKDTAASVKTILGNASALIGEYRADIKKAGTAWSSMAASLAHARKKGHATSIEMGGDTSSVEEAVEKKHKKKEKEAEGSV